MRQIGTVLTGKLRSTSYAWSVTSQPNGASAPTFDNVSDKNTNVTFHQSGNYTFTVTIKDSNGLSVTSGVTVKVA